jgi:glycosyltransferase involved in cell wall biosynthesis
MNRVVLMPTKNDAWILEKTLPCILMWADYVIVADQNSTDQTLEICKQSPKVKVINNDSVFHSTKVRQMLLDEARKIPGKNIIFSIDSDEIVTADILTKEFWEKMESCPIGTSFLMQWVQLWRTPIKYRDDNSIWSNRYKHFAFIDDGVSAYTYEYEVNDHNPRVPTALTKNFVKLNMPKVLHYQFVNWERMLAKQRFYRIQDFIQTQRSLTNAIQINRMYVIAKDESGLKLKDIPNSWISAYEEKGINLRQVKDQGLFWYDVEVLKWFKKYNPESFALLDIWDVNWEEKRLLAEKVSLETPLEPIRDPRGLFINFYHNHQGLIMPLLNFIAAARKKLS